VRVYAGLEGEVGGVSDRLLGVERGLGDAKKERRVLSSEMKDVMLKERQLRNEVEALAQGWEKTKEATLEYQESLQSVLEGLRRKKEVSAALEQQPAASGKSAEVGVDKGRRR